MKNLVYDFAIIISIFILSACKPTDSKLGNSSSPETTTTASHIAPTVTPEVFEDCIWGGTAKAWLDVNANGVWDNNEQPLGNVLFFVDDTHNKLKQVGSYSVSNSLGEAELSVWLPGCPKVAFEVYAQAPDNYQPTSQIRISDEPEKKKREFQFGFIYKQGMPTATPRPNASIICNSYKVTNSSQPIASSAVTDMAIAPDGAVWVTTNNNLVTRFNSNSQQQKVFSMNDGLPDDVIRTITIAPDGAVWVGTNEGAALYNGSNWVRYSTTNQTDFSNNWVNNIAITNDGKVWFANFMNGISRLNPKTNLIELDVINKSLLTSDYGIDDIRISPSGSIWFFSNASIYQLTPPPDSKWVVHKRDYNEKIGGITALNSSSTIVISDSEIWLVGSTDAGPSVVKFNPIERTWTTYNYQTTGGAMVGGVISSLAIAKDNSIWIGFTKTGVMHFTPNDSDNQNGKWLYYNTDNGLLSNVTYEIVVAPDNALWIGNDTGFVSRCVENK